MATDPHILANVAADRPVHLERYGEHARRLQTWIGAYSAGLASLLMYQFRTAAQDATAKIQAEAIDPQNPGYVVELRETGMQDALVTALELIAIAIVIQVVLLMVNKGTQFVLANRPENSRSYKLADVISDIYWIDVLADLGSIAFLGLATYMALGALGFV